MILEKTERFQADLKKFSRVVELIPDNQEREEFQKLLNSLIFEVKRLDTMFVDMVYSNQITSTGKELKENIADTRKKIEKKISRYSKMYKLDIEGFK